MVEQIMHYILKKLYRKWKYKFIKSYDQHIFELKDKPLGKYNKTLLNFYKSKNLMYNKNIFFNRD